MDELILPAEIDLADIDGATLDVAAKAVELQQSTEKMGRWAKHTVELLLRMQTALTNQGVRSDLLRRTGAEPETFEQFLAMAKWPKTTAYRIIQRYEEGKLLPEGKAGQEPRASGERAQISVRYPKHVKALDKALMKFQAGTNEMFSGGQVPQQTQQLLDDIAQWWTGVYQSVIGDDVEPDFQRAVAAPEEAATA